MNYITSARTLSLPVVTFRQLYNLLLETIDSVLVSDDTKKNILISGVPKWVAESSLEHWGPEQIHHHMSEVVSFIQSFHPQDWPDLCIVEGPVCNAGFVADLGTLGERQVLMLAYDVKVNNDHIYKTTADNEYPNAVVA